MNCSQLVAAQTFMSNNVKHLMINMPFSL